MRRCWIGDGLVLISDRREAAKILVRQILIAQRDHDFGPSSILAVMHPKTSHKGHWHQDQKHDADLMDIHRRNGRQVKASPPLPP